MNLLTSGRVYGGQTINPSSTMTHFHIPSAYYLVILYSFRNSCGGLK
ncbi:hypothetical protein E2C01_063900 [Portunus trituberculatus]|uniref:Uncharacterized protein n=1 Tax=Portunus trituberculatus TaxID=210409 RepID=A0A5B7HBR0_PORTR|nr:hypothetical protein [Portunus trituberculatus]